MRKVYLAGGMHSNWRQIVTKVPGFSFIDPCDHQLGDKAALYTLWDLEAIKVSDIVFAFMAQDNPSGVGLALEVGYAKALGKLVLLVDDSENKYFPIVRETADMWFCSMERALEFLRALGKID